MLTWWKKIRITYINSFLHKSQILINATTVLQKMLIDLCEYVSRQCQTLTLDVFCFIAKYSTTAQYLHVLYCKFSFLHLIFLMCFKFFKTQFSQTHDKICFNRPQTIYSVYNLSPFLTVNHQKNNKVKYMIVSQFAI